MKDYYLFYTALGDSISTGVGSLLAPGFARIYAKITEQYFGIKVLHKNIAQNGATTENLLKMVQSPSAQSFIRNAQIITISIGGNDIKKAGTLYLRTGNEDYLSSSFYKAIENISNTINVIVNLKSTDSSPYMIRILNVYNPTPNLLAVEQWINRYNSFLTSTETSNIQIVDIYSVFEENLGNFLFIDHIHPNYDGYRAIAYELFRTGYFPLDIEIEKRLFALNNL